MIVFNKYKTPTYLNLENVFDFSQTINNNSFRIFSLFKHSKKLIRSLLELHFYIYSLYPFSPLLFKNSARYHLKFDSTILIFCGLDCYDNLFRFI